MLRYIRIRDFALIHNVEMEFGPGFNLLTGETGSGKSIIVGALSILVGERSSQEMVRTGADMAVLEAQFVLEPREGIACLLEEAGVEVEDETLLIRREISAGGRSRIFVNNSLATLSLLKSIGELLADIHGQQERQSLLDFSTHREWVDRFGGNAAAVDEIRRAHLKLRETAQRLEAMSLDEQERLRRVDVLQFQLEEIRRINPQIHEKEDLENERRVLTNRERVFGLSSEAYGLLYESEPSVLSQVGRLGKILQELEVFDSSWAAQREALRDVVYRLEDLAYAIRDYTSGIDFSPERLDQVEQRLSDLERLTRKYGNSITDILAYSEQCRREYEELVSYADTSKSLAQEFETELKQYMVLADKLSEKRRKDAARLEHAIRKEFEVLSMERMELGVRFQPRDAGPRSGRIPSFCGPFGTDQLEFMIAPNKGEEPKPLAKIASGGELSRIMLAIKTLCGGGDPGKTLVFDEVDAGIGGRVAEVVGRRLRDLAQENQVLCVTHLPQIAAFASHHQCVRKEIVGSRTETLARALGESERAEELARMLGGETITETTRRHAREMLTHARASAKDRKYQRT